MQADVYSATLLLLFVLDPFGNVPLVNGILRNVPAARRRRIVLRECLFAFAILATFMLAGKKFLELLRLSETSLSIAGGIVLFLIALRMVFHGVDQVFGDAADGEPFLVPLAVPAIAGPSALATVMLLATREPDRVGIWLLALSVAMLLTTIVLTAADRLQRLLGPRLVIALERLTGLVLTAIAVEMLLAGVRTFIADLGR